MININTETCDGCAICMHVCPHGVLEISERKAFASSEDDCIECGACQLNCEPGALTVIKGTGCLLVVIKEDILGMKKEAACCG